MVNLWQQNVHPGPTWCFFGGEPLLHDKKEHGLDLLETCWHHLKGGAPWQPSGTVVAGFWEPGAKPWFKLNLNTFFIFLKPEILWNTWGWDVGNGCTDFKWIDQTLDENLGVVQPTTEWICQHFQETWTCSCLTKLCCLLWPSRSAILCWLSGTFSPPLTSLTSWLCFDPTMEKSFE